MNKLKGNKKINLLFEKGKSVKHFPFRLIYLEHKEVSWGVSVSKKAFALAVDRNKTKRVIKEIFRTNHLNPKSGGFLILVYESFSVLSFEEASFEIIKAVKSHQTKIIFNHEQ